MEVQNEIKLPKLFDKNPELKKELLKVLKPLTPEKKAENVRAVFRFLRGEATWAEIKHIPVKLLKEFARIGHYKFKTGDFQAAEMVFKGLAILDHHNWYFRTALGAIFQKQGKFEEAIQEYSLALELKSDEVTALVNRGQCFMHLKDFDSALEDFGGVNELGLDKDNAWQKRANSLSQAILTMKGKA